MEPIEDDVFGYLSFNGSWTREIDLTFLGVTSTVEIIVEGNDDNEAILDEQRMSFRKLAGSIQLAEDGIFEYYKRVRTDYRLQFGDDADDRMPVISDKSRLSNFTRLTGVVFPMVLSVGDETIGFLLECTWDQEHGLGVKITNDEIEVGSQDLIT